MLTESDRVASFRDHSNAIAGWLFLCCAFIAVMVLIGGATRLTHSGLSMVEWKPVTGLLPPLNESEWQSAFSKYQQYPEFKKINSTMTLAEFQSIFWFEYIHRVWGRVIGLVFFLPFVFFLFKGYISQKLFPKLLGMLLLGALQGGLGWFMVKSGLVDRPDVSHYRLAAHLLLAFLIYGYIFWVALDLIYPRRSRICLVGPTRTASALLGLMLITVISGAFVAGLDAGFSYNTFPLMAGLLFPPDLFLMQPWLRNFFENAVTVQFTHRVLAIVLFLAIASLWLNLFRRPMPLTVRNASHLVFAAALIQLALGIMTLLLVVPLPLAVAHQGGALLLFTTLIWLRHRLRY